jgi:hypothetical protein
MKMPLLAPIVNCTPIISLFDNLSCELFSPQEFLAFEYLDDIWFQEFDGPANKFSEILG